MKRTPRRPGRGRTATPPTTTTPRPARRSAKRVLPSGLVAPVTTAPRTVYPALEPYRHGWLRVSATHEVYWEESGNPRGKAAVFVHGGPGCGASANSRQYFDPARYRIVVFDQRGCGRSRPTASLEDNTTWHLVEDMEALRKHLRITQWLVFGGSWGSTLALAYAQTHPERVSALVLRGIFLLRRQEIQWFYQHGASEVFPDRWEYFLEPIPAAERGDLVGAYYRRLTGSDPRAALKAAKAWAGWEAATSHLLLNEGTLAVWAQDQYALTVARIECHYFFHCGFFQHEGQLLRDLNRIRHIPTVIVQGRYDMPCPMRSAWDLHRAWPEADFRIVGDAGHSASEAGITHELILSTDRFART
jgi:proline iminopeptidase